MLNKIKTCLGLSALLLSSTVDAVCNSNIALTKPDSLYTDHGNGTVSDMETGLMWMKCSQGRSGVNCGTGSALAINWKQALEAVQTANSDTGTSGYTDWRLPTIIELGTLAERACFSPSINATIFPATVYGYYWSSSPYAGGTSSAWIINFSDVSEFTLEKSTNAAVRLVRGGH